MVRPLQPIGLIYGVMQHKLGAAEPDLPAVRQEAAKINEFANAAIEECVNMGTWLAPEPDVLARVDSGVTECVGLLATMLHFCGFNLDNEIENLPVQVPRDAMRMVLSAALLAVTDALTVPATLTLSAAVRKDEVTVTLRISREAQGDVDRYEDGCRKLVWRDVEALAFAENVGLSRKDDCITLRFAVQSPTQAPVS